MPFQMVKSGNIEYHISGDTQEENLTWERRKLFHDNAAMFYESSLESLPGRRYNLA